MQNYVFLCVFFHACCCFSCCLVAKPCPALCHPMDCGRPGSSVRGDSPGKNKELSCHFLLQGILPTQGSTRVSCLGRQILYHWATREDHWVYIWSEVAQSCPTLYDPVDCSPPGSSVLGILQARILEWVAISLLLSNSLGDLWPRNLSIISVEAKNMLHWVKKWHRLEDIHIQENIKLAQNLSMLLVDEVSTDWAFLENWVHSYSLRHWS